MHLNERESGGTAPSRVWVPVAQEVPDTTTAGGRLVFHMFTALAEFIRELIVDGTREGAGARPGVWNADARADL